MNNTTRDEAVRPSAGATGRDEFDWTLLAGCRSSDELHERLKRALEEARLRPGYRLPPVRELMTLSGLRHGEVYRATTQLAQEGYVEQRRGSGTFVSNRSGNATSTRSATRLLGVVPPATYDVSSYHIVGANLDGICGLANRRGYRVEVISANSQEQHEYDFAERLMSKGLDGIIWVQPPALMPIALVRLVDAGFPTVLTGRGYATLPLPVVTYSGESLGALVGDYMLKRGRHRLACLVGGRDDMYTQFQVDGIRGVLERMGLELPEDLILTVRLGHTSPLYTVELEEAVTRYLSARDDFDAVYALYPEGVKCAVAVSELGHHRCPDDFHCLFLGSSHVLLSSEWPQIPISFIEQPHTLQAERALRVLESLWGIGSEDIGKEPPLILREDPRLPGNGGVSPSGAEEATRTEPKTKAKHGRG